MNLYWSGPLESHIRNFIFRGVGGPLKSVAGWGVWGAPWPPLIGEISSISQSCKSEAHILFHAWFNIGLNIFISGVWGGIFYPHLEHKSTNMSES